MKNFLVVVTMEQGRGPNSETHLKMKNYKEKQGLTSQLCYDLSASYLAQSAGYREAGQLPQNSRMSLDEADELQSLSGGEDGDGEVAAAPLVHGEHHVAGLCPVLQLHPLLYSSRQSVTGQTDQQQQLAHSEERISSTGLLGVLFVHEHRHASN